MTTIQHAAGVSLYSATRHSLLADVMQLSAEGIERGDIVAYLQRSGLGEAEAAAMLTTVETQLSGKRDRFRTERRRAFMLASLQVVVALVMAGTGLLGDRVPSMILGAVLAVTAYRRLGVANDRTFGDVVLTNRIAQARLA